MPDIPSPLSSRLPSGIQYVPFAVARRPLCVWDWDLDERNLAFLDSLKPDYFDYVASHVTALDDKERQYAAMMIRTVYSQALETFAALGCAIVQAPGCIVGWMDLYRQRELVEVARALMRGEPYLSCLNPRPLSWSQLADACTACIVLEDKTKEESIRAGYRALWRRLSAEFLDEGQQEEYNSLKHGLRVQPGGFELRIGREDVIGVAAPPERMVSMGGSEFGSSFFQRVQLGESGRHYRLIHASRNWLPGALATRLQLIAMSIRNLISFAKALNGVDPTTVQFVWPTPLSAFEDAFLHTPGTTAASFDTILSATDIVEFDGPTILSVYNRPDGEPSDGSGPDSPAVP